MNRALAAVAVASLSFQGATALRKGSGAAVETEVELQASRALVQQVAAGASDELASSGFGEDCKVEVIDPQRCAEETAKKCTKMCKAPAPWLPDYPCGLKPGCSVNCPTVAECKVRLRASLSGDVNTETYDSIRLDFALQDYQVVRGHQLIKDFLQNTTHKAILTNLIKDILVDARGTVQQKLDVWKKDFKGLLIEKLGKDETFGDYSFLHGFVGNSTQLVEALVPLSSMSFDTLRIANADGDQEPMVRSMLEMPEARTYAELRFTHALADMSPLVRMAPGFLLGALTAMKFPRAGLALGAVSGGLLWYFTEALADSLGPRILGHSDVKFKAKLPEDAQKLGAPEQLEISAWFAGTSMYAAMQSLPLNMVQAVLRNLALEATADPERIKNMPVKVVEANFKLHGERHHLAVAAGSYCDIEATIDLSCMPNCPGPCGGFIKCG